MRLNIFEKYVLYYYGCPSHKNTVERLKYLTSFMVDPRGKRRMLALLKKIDTEKFAQWYPCCYQITRNEIRDYDKAVRSVRLIEADEDYLCDEEDLYDKAV